MHAPTPLSIRPPVETARRMGRKLSAFAAVAALLLSFGQVEAATGAGSVTQRIGNPIPDSTAPGNGNQLAGLIVNILPAEAAAAGATWTPPGATAASASGGSLLILLAAGDGGQRALKFSTVAGFDAPVAPVITLTRGFETIVTFTYRRTTAPVLPATASASATRGLTFSFSPRATGSPATSYTATVGGGETLTGLGLELTTSTGTLRGTPAKSGTFTFTFTASNSAGKSTPMVLTLTVTEPVQLVVPVNATQGSVAVTPNRAGLLFAANETVTVTAKPKSPDFLFDGWTFAGATPASVTEAKTKFTFTPGQAVVAATAKFVANPFLTRADSYAGRFAPTANVGVANSGAFALKVTTLGQFTGRLKLGASSFSFKGAFHADGSAPDVTIPRRGQAPITISSLQMDFAGSEQIRGNVDADDGAIAFALDRAVFDAKTNPCPQAAIDSKTGKPTTARYTLVLQPGPTMTPSIPNLGAGTATVLPNGTVRFVGVLNDGTAVAQSAVISKTGTWPFHTLLYQKRGVLTGDLTFRDLGATGDLDGTLDWIKPARSTPGVSDPEGFAVRIGVIGLR